MELRHLAYFVAVVDEGSFTRAAHRLSIVQSGVSAGIKTLERELGAALLDRTSRRVRLTSAGEALLPRARATLDAAQSARDAVGEVHGGLRGALTVGTMTTLGRLDLPQLLGRFHALHPGVALRVRVAPNGSIGLAEAMVAGSLDLAFVSLPDPVPAALTLRTLDALPMTLIVRDDHRLADRQLVRLEDLADEHFIDFPPGYGNRLVADRAFAAAGIPRQVTLEVTGVEFVGQYVRHGLGIAIIPPIAVRDEPGLRSLTLAEPLPWTVSLAMSATRAPSAAARALADLAVSAAQVLAGGKHMADSIS